MQVITWRSIFKKWKYDPKKENRDAHTHSKLKVNKKWEGLKEMGRVWQGVPWRHPWQEAAKGTSGTIWPPKCRGVYLRALEGSGDHSPVTLTPVLPTKIMYHCWLCSAMTWERQCTVNYASLSWVDNRFTDYKKPQKNLTKLNELEKKGARELQYQ